MAGSEALKSAGKPDLRTDAVEVGGHDHACDDRPGGAAIIKAGEEGVLAVEASKQIERPIVLISMRPSSRSG
jgi:hypothetical protein